MRIYSNSFRIFITLLMLFTCAAASADMMWKQEDTITADGKSDTLTQTIYISGPRFAMVSSDGLRIVLDMNAQTLSTIDSGSESFNTVSLAEIDALRDRMANETDAIIEDALKNIPPAERDEYRKLLEEKLKEMNSDDSAGQKKKHYSAVGDTKSLLGYKAWLYRLEGADGLKEEYWCSREIDTTELAALLDMTKSVKVMKNLSASFSSLDHGFPLESLIDDGSSVVSSKVIELSFDRIDPAVFSVPETYIKSVK